MMCQHCMDDSSPDGGLMDEATFGNALKFAKDGDCQIVIISGGEPTEHPEFFDYCRRASRSGIPFAICTNGMWLGDEQKEYRFERVARLKGFSGAQIYSNPKWYRLHDDTVRKYRGSENRWKPLGIVLDINEIRGMKDIGRALNCEEAMKEVRESKYHNSCLSAHLTAVQTNSIQSFNMAMRMQVRFCSPLVDWRGDVHASESWLCQSFGNVNRDGAEALFEKIKAGRPCGRCLLCHKYLTEDDPKMKMARELLGQDGSVNV